MPDERIQLKQEEIVGNEVVLNDINPKTSTKSVDDSSTGAQLDQTLDRMWNTINNKLSRIVNSVNGRTGVVVLRSSDVGLGNVDNVSFADIKQWVLEQIDLEFGSKQLKLFDNMDEVLEIIAQNDLVNRNAAFFAKNGFISTGDKKSYIGYIWLDKATDKLTYISMPINTVGYTDNSIIYDEELNGKDLSGGGLGINIYKYEDALEVYNDLSGNKEESGLRIIKEKIVPKLYYFEGAYGNGSINDTTALLYTLDNKSDECKNADNVYLTIDGYTFSKIKIREHGFKIGDIIICHFRDYRDDMGVVPTNMFTGLLGRSPAIGMVTQVASDENDRTFKINLYTIRQNIGPGLKYLDWGTSGNTVDKQLAIKLTTGSIPGSVTSINLSGLCLNETKNAPFTSNVNESCDGQHMEDFHETNIVLPEGSVPVFEDRLKSDGGLYLATNMSLCVVPTHYYGSGSSHVDNWPVLTPKNFKSKVTEDPQLDDTCLISVNLLKAVATSDKVTEDGDTIDWKFANASGLRISGHSHNISTGFLGMTGTPIVDTDGNVTNKTDTNDTTGGIPFDAETSGGLSVNVGKFLEIEPGDYPEDESTYYDGGKVNVRIGRGLTDDGDNNRIGIKVGNENGGLGFDAEGNLVIVNYKPVGVNLTKLKIVDQLGGEIEYNPSLEEIDNQQTTTITLGPGLKITTD